MKMNSSSIFNALRWGILFFCVALFSIDIPASARPVTTASEGDNIWLATDYGLYRYNKAQDEWTVFSSGNGLAGNDVRDVGFDEGIIWAATDGGVSNSDVRFGDWRSYTASDGLPGDDVRCLAFSEDYVWIGTSSGAASFDKILEEWKVYKESDGLASDEVNDIAVDGGRVWFATSGGISELDSEFGKWTDHTKEAHLSSVNVTRVIKLGDFIWLITDEGLTRYDKKLRSWKSYSTADGIVSYTINDVVIDGESIWLATEKGVSSYDPESDSWSEGLIYHTMLPSRNVMDLAVDGELIWFCTSSGVSRYDGGTGSWRHYTDADGLLDNDSQSIFVSGQVFVITETGINLYDKNTQEWKNYEFPSEAAREAGKGRSNRGFRLDDRGIGFDMSQESQLRLSGSSSLEFADVSGLHPERYDDYEWHSRNDINLKAVMPGDRSIVGFYNDVREENVKYGATYRGGDEDVLQELTGGEFEAKMRNAELIADVNLSGGGGRLRKKFDNTKLSVEPRYGEQRGYFETDFFTYRTGETIYELSHQNVIPETDQVIVKKEKLQRGVDYLIVYSSGLLVFHREELVEEGEQIEIRYQYEFTEDDAENDRLAILTTGLDVGDKYYAGFDMLHGDDADVVSLNAEGKGINAGPVSMKLRPEVAYSRRWLGNSEAEGFASRAEFTANAPKTQFKADYEQYGQDFWSIAGRETRFGELDRHIGFFSQVDVTQWSPVTLRWQQDRSSDADMITTSEEDARMNVVFSKKPYPTVALTGERNTVEQMDQEEIKNAARADFQYELPNALLSPINFRRAEVNAYYRESRGRSVDEEDKMQTGYVKLQISPMEDFVLNTSYKSSRTRERAAGSEAYQLREELERWLLRSNFSSIEGIISTIHLDDLRTLTSSESGEPVENKDRYMAASLNLIPGVWIRKLEMLNLGGRYSFSQQTVSIADESASESGESRLADSNSRYLRFQANLRPHDMLIWTGTYERIKSWIDSVPIVANTRKYRSEAEFKPGFRNRITLEYSQERWDEDSTSQTNLYSPSLWWETRWSQNWTTRLRGIYQREIMRELGEISETGSTLTPSLSFRYTKRKLPYAGRLYLTQGFSVSTYRGESNSRDLASETYSTSSVIEWKMTKNLSFRLRANISYEDKQEGSDKGSASVYGNVLARF